MLTQNDISRLTGADVYDIHGDKIGSVVDLYLDACSGNPAWVMVRTGLLGAREAFVPLQQATASDGRVTVAVDKDTVNGAPHIDIDTGAGLGYVQENELYTYYGLFTTGADAGKGPYEPGNIERAGRSVRHEDPHVDQ